MRAGPCEVGGEKNLNPKSYKTLQAFCVQSFEDPEDMVRRLGKKAALGNKEFSRVYGQRLGNVGFTWITKVCGIMAVQYFAFLRGFG